MSTYSRKNDGSLIAVIVIACFLALFNSTALNAGLPLFMEIFDASVTEVQWIMIGYTVIMGVVSPLAAWFVRRFTLRNYFVYSMFAYAALSLASGLFANVYFIIVLRAFQGIAGAALIPVTMIAIYRFVPRHRQPLFLTIQSMSLSLGPAIGPVLAGLMLMVLSWRWLFWFSVPLSLLAGWLGMRVFPKEEAESAESIDALSLVTIVIGSMLVLMLCAAACGLLIAITAMLTGQCSRGFAASLVTLPVVVQAVILMVNGNVGTGVAVLGAFSLVRFRSMPDSSRDITLIFLAMGTGLATSMAYTGYALLLTAVVCALLLALHFIHPFSQPLLLRVTIPEDLDYTGVFDDLFAAHTRRWRLEGVKTTGMGSLFELRYTVVLKDPKQEKAFLDELRCRNGNLTLSLTRNAPVHEEL